MRFWRQATGEAVTFIAHPLESFQDAAAGWLQLKKEFWSNGPILFGCCTDAAPMLLQSLLYPKPIQAMPGWCSLPTLLA